MKKLFCLVLCLCMTLSLLPLSAQAGGLNYLALGDSISTGYGLKDVPNECFANILANSIGYDLTNYAVNGNTTSGVIMQLADPTVQTAIANADLITLTIGGNDMLALFYAAILNTYNTMTGGTAPLTLSDVGTIMSNPSDPRQMMLMMSAQLALTGNPTAGTPSFVESEELKTGLAVYATALVSIVQSIHALNPSVKVVVATQYNPYATFTGLYDSLRSGFETGVLMLNKAIVDSAQAGGYYVADVYGAFSGSEENLYNAAMEPMNLDIHPNAAGHAVIEKTFFSAIEPLL